MSISAYGSTFVLFFVDGDVVKNVVGLRQEMGLEGHLLWLWNGVEEGAEVSGRECFGGPLLVRIDEKLALVALIPVAQKITIRACQLVGLAVFPEPTDGEILTEMLRVYTRRWGKHAGEERLCPIKFRSVGSRIDQLKFRQATEQGLIIFEVGEEADKAVVGRVRIDKRRDKMLGNWFVMAEGNGKAVHKIAFRF